MLSNIFVLILGRWLVLTPHIFFFKDKFPLLYLALCMLKCLVVQFDCHSSNPLYLSQTKGLLFFAVPSIRRRCCVVKYLYYLIYYLYGSKIYFLYSRCCASISSL